MPSSAGTTRRKRRVERDPRAFVARSLASRAQSVAEIETKLAARGVEAEAAASAVGDAIRLGFLDDEELAGQLARGFRARGYGRRRAAMTLRRRGLADSVAHAALDDAFGGSDEAVLAAQALGSRAIGDDRARRRAVAFLVRRGFSPAAAWRAVRPAEPP
jgi:regulatory protein